MFLACCLSFSVLHAQIPLKFSYQSVIRDASGKLVKEKAIRLQISIIQGAADGVVVYAESHIAECNANGLLSVEIGGEGAEVLGGSLSDIDWSNGPFFIKTETDPTGGTDYTLSGISQLLSVPYAMHAKTAESVSGAITETDPVFMSSQAAGITSADISHLSMLSGVNTGDQDISGIAENASAIQDTAAQIRADFPETAQFVSVEKDPLFTGWDKKTGINITESQISDLGSYLETETDPLFEEWDKTSGISISESQITDLGSYIETETQNLDAVLTTGNSAGNKTISSLADPVDGQDAATKAYVDELKNVIYNELLEAGLNAVVKDIDGNSYKTIKVGEQIWMAENLKTTRYNDGTDIPLITGNDDWSVLESPGYCWYNNDSLLYAGGFGGLYNWYSVETAKLCPPGWYVPDDEDWTILVNYLGGESVAGGKLKEVGTRHWHSPNTDASNESGFTARAGGQRNSEGVFEYVGQYGVWWSSTQTDLHTAWTRGISHGGMTIGRGFSDKKTGRSVRCVREVSPGN